MLKGTNEVRHTVTEKQIGNGITRFIAVSYKENGKGCFSYLGIKLWNSLRLFHIHLLGRQKSTVFR